MNKISKAILTIITVFAVCGGAFGATIAYWEFDGAGWDYKDAVGTYDLTVFSTFPEDSALKVNPIPNYDTTLPWNGLNDAQTNPFATWMSSDPLWIPNPVATHDPTFDFVPGKAFTIEGWIRPFSTGMVVHNRHANAAHMISPNYTGWAIMTTGGGTTLEFRIDIPGAAAIANTPVVKDELIHFAGVYNAADGTIHLYVNYQLKASAIVPAAASGNYGGALAFGGRDVGGGLTSLLYSGGMDEIRYSDVALAPEEFLGYVPPFTAYWELDGETWDGKDAVGPYDLVKVGDAATSAIRVDPIPNPETRTPWLGANDAVTNPASIFFSQNDAYYFPNPVATHDPAFDFDPELSFTVEGWVTPVSGTGWIVGNRTANPDHAYNGNWKGWDVHVQTDGTELVFYIDGNPQTGFHKTAVAPVVPDEHVHFAAVYNSDEEMMKLYINGQLEAQTPADPNWTFNRGGQLSIGARDVGTGYDSWNMTGRIDEIRFTRQVLTPDKFLDKPCGLWGYLPSDINRDCYIDFRDFSLIALKWLDVQP